MSTLEIDVGDLRPRAVEFTADDLVVTLADGRKITTPLDWYPRLKRASTKERANFEIMPMGIHWPDLDEDLGIVGMLKGRRAELGGHISLSMLPPHTLQATIAVLAMRTIVECSPQSGQTDTSSKRCRQ